MSDLYFTWNGRDYDIPDTLTVAQMMELEDLTGKSADEMSSTRIAVGTIAIAIKIAGGASLRTAWDALLKLSAADLPQPQRRGPDRELPELVEDPTEDADPMEVSS
jgi:hypothetical protein